MRGLLGIVFALTRTTVFAGLAAAVLIPASAYAQFSDSYNFLKAVRDRDGAKATEFVDQPGTTVINTRDRETGETALHIVISRRDSVWLNFLLAKGAKPDLADNRGTTPLMLAAELRFLDGARLLLATGAQVDKANDKGETPLIRAVQLRDLPMVRLLIAGGANPEKADTLAGMSARDYAKRDSRSSSLLTALDTAKPAQKATAEMEGPKL
jgi:hypothetical protein